MARRTGPSKIFGVCDVSQSWIVLAPVACSQLLVCYLNAETTGFQLNVRRTTCWYVPPSTCISHQKSAVVVAQSSYDHIMNMCVTFVLMPLTVAVSLVRFELQVVIGSRAFPVVTVLNKKDGRKEAAEAALKMLMTEGKFALAQEKSQVVCIQLIG